MRIDMRTPEGRKVGHQYRVRDASGSPFSPFLIDTETHVVGVYLATSGRTACDVNGCPIPAFVNVEGMGFTIETEGEAPRAI